MGQQVLSKIILELKEAYTYYSISVDSTPDMSHVDQLTFVLRIAVGKRIDNAPNMAGQYNGLQVKPKEHCTCALFFPKYRTV
ncbi:hypothetical protein RI129_004725 [Pyrocoelia pectoralis]|uniref:DUF4371 domain-containing protein n=1 Tax=Pyrocoelia pectoralis TaxID=417401 RepID=A0AAN7VJT3_9COLE